MTTIRQVEFISASQYRVSLSDVCKTLYRRIRRW